MSDRLAKHELRRRSETPDEQQKRRLESEALRTQQIQRQTAELELQAVRRAAFKPTSADIEILTQIAESVGTIKAPILLTDAARKQVVYELLDSGFIDRYRDPDSLSNEFGVVFKITRPGMALLEELMDDKPVAEKQKKRRRKAPMPKPKVEEHWREVMSSGNRDLIHEYLTLGEIALAKKIGTSRGTLRGCECFINRPGELQRFNREHGAPKRR
jgi:hypothetical protein